jgi:hypothetical protein
MHGRDPPGEARHGQLEGAPEEVHWTHLADEASTECFEDPIGLHKRLPEAVAGVGVVARMGLVLGKDWIGSGTSTGFG